MISFYKICFLIFTCLLLSCKKEIPSIKPEIKSITESVYASGIIKSDRQYNVFPKSNGVVKEFFVNEGDILLKGAPIMSIQNQTASLNSENATLNASYFDYTRNVDKLNQIKKDIEFAKRKLKSDSLGMARQNQLWLQGIGTKTEQEQRELAFQNTRTGLENLYIKLSETQKQLKFSDKQSKINQQISNAILSDYTVKSEIDGRVYSLLKEVGEMVNTQTQLGVIGDDKTFKLELQLDEYDIIKIKKGQEVIVRLDSYSDDVFEAVIDKINPIMNDKTRTFTVEASFVKKPDVLYPNLSVEANIVISQKTNILTIPMEYLIDRKFVFMKDGTKKEVKIGLKDYQLAEIIEGLDANSEIIRPQ
ncbi:MAG: HlyD family efflux transporter periplasmic adaptor subunit [Saprospiraceae bacterium]|nr:HlyD family efflux transporter periplasmic adaptor subunit [Saprospiraceae bacterium]